MIIRNMAGCRILLAAALSIVIFQVPAIAQLDEAERLIYLAKAIKRIAVKQIDTAQPQDESKAEVERKFECKAYDKDGKEVDISSDQAGKLYKWTVKDSAGTVVEQKGVIEKIEEVKDKTRKAQNVLKLVMDKGHKAVKLEMSLADEYSTYSSAVGKSSIAAGKGGAGMFRSIGRWIGRHPCWTAAGAVVVGGGVAVASGGGGGSSGSNGSNGGGGGSSTTAGDQSATVDVSGTWHGTDSYGGTFTLYLTQVGTSVSGTFQDGPSGQYQVGSVSGSVNGNVFSISAILPNEDGSDTAIVNGNTMTGSSFVASR